MIARLGAVAATTAALLALAPPAFGGFTAQMTDLGHVAFSGGGNRMADVSTARDTGGGGGLPNNYWTVEPFPSGLPGDALDYDPCHASDNGQFLWCDTDKTPVPTVTSVTGTANRDDFRVGSAYDPIDITGPVDMGAGDDQVTLFGPGARALVQGGAGTGDTLNMYGGYLGTINQRWRVDLAAGTATSTSGPGSSFTFSGFETVNGFTSPYSGPGFEELGDDGDNRLFGTNQVDTLIGRGGVDQIVAKAGDDVVTGGEGADTIDCGDGDDTAIVDAEEDGVLDCETLVEPAEAP